MLVGQTIGKEPYLFEIEQELGSGAMGTVYRAVFRREGKPHPVALKIVALGLLGNEGAMARFEREANILKQLKHDHIVRLYATGTYRKTPFIAMEFIDGEALDRVLARRGRLTWEEVVAYGKQLCKALQYAHEKGIIHRDLKPSNLMITSEGSLKLTDFGIAKDTDVTALTGHNSTIGTAAYMSPEQCKGDKHLTNKSDLYSLGIVFYELLTGKKPFYADTTVDMFLKHVNEPAPRIGKQVSELPAKLETLILQLMEKDKDDRPTEAAWVLRMLEEVEEDAYARISAGLIAATSKRQNRPRNLDGSKLDDSDRDAARALRGKKRKRKRDDVPFLERTWVKATGLILALLLLIAGGYYAFRPSSPAKLIAAVDRADSPQAKIDSARKYLENYGEQPGEMTDKAAAAFREGHVGVRENQLDTRFRAAMIKPFEEDDAEAYRLAWEAIEHEQKGSLSLAEASWRKVKDRFPEEGKLPFALKDDVLAKARWGWLAEKRLADLHGAQQKLGEARKIIDDTQRNDLAFSVDPATPLGLTIRGLRLEDFRDPPKAAAVWKSLADQTERDPAARIWRLLALNKLARNAIEAKSENAEVHRLRLVEAKVADAATTLASIKDGDPEANAKRRKIRVYCREVMDLYDNETAEPIVKQVKSARELAAKVPNR